MLSSRIISRLQDLPTPFYLYDTELLIRTLEELNGAALRYGYTVHYALKANFDPVLVDIICKAGLGADCVSGNEMRYAVERGFPPRSIVYAGVGKTDAEIAEAIGTGIFSINCESAEELGVIDAIARSMGQTAPVALRLNPEVEPDTHQHISTGQADSKFGIPTAEYTQILGQWRHLSHVDIKGLHFHIGSQVTDMGRYHRLCVRVNELYRQAVGAGMNIRHINMGGGLGVDYNNPEKNPVPDFRVFFEVFRSALQTGDVPVHFELGRSVIAQCGELITRVLYRKTNGSGRNIALVDASMSQLIRPALYGAVHRIENLTGSGTKQSYTVAGTVCESADVFARDYPLKEVSRGDILSIKTAGAYGASMASRYNMHDLPRAVYSHETEG